MLTPRLHRASRTSTSTNANAVAMVCRLRRLAPPKSLRNENKDRPLCQPCFCQFSSTSDGSRRNAFTPLGRSQKSFLNEFKTRHSRQSSPFMEPIITISASPFLPRNKRWRSCIPTSTEISTTRVFSTSTSSDKSSINNNNNVDGGSPIPSLPKLPIKWQTAVKQIPKEYILPEGLKTHKLQAFFGDKTLGAMAASMIERAHLIQEMREAATTTRNETEVVVKAEDDKTHKKQQEETQIMNQEIDQSRFLRIMNSTSTTNYLYSEASATKLISTALSNQFFAQHIATILPDNDDNKSTNVFVETSKSMSVHSIGTMIEAAVAAVQQTNSLESREAIVDLVDWLLAEAIQKNRDMNSKGKLLELGGVVSKTQKIGGTSHEPIFEATASLKGVTHQSKGRSKKMAEQEACRLVLQQLGYVDAPIVEELDSNANDLLFKWEPPTEQWNYFIREDDDDMTVLDLAKENEKSSKETAASDGSVCPNVNHTAEEWWMSRAFHTKTAFRATMLAPTIFPDVVAAVDSWTRRPEMNAFDTDNSGTTENKTNISDDDSGVLLEGEQREAAVMVVLTFHSFNQNQQNENLPSSFTYEYTTLIEQDLSSATKARAKLGLQANQLISERIMAAAAAAAKQ